jgi:mannose-6-phosphate isomerase-like protein (cupin superfamily)
LQREGSAVANTNYVINMEPLFSTLERFDVDELVANVNEPWWNQTLIRVGDDLVRLGVFEGEYHWHKHDDQDEFFFVLDGEMRIELEGREPAVLGKHQGYSVKKGLRHRPVVPTRAVVLMIEKAGIVPTGD